LGSIEKNQLIRFLIIQYAAYPTPPPAASRIHGRHNGVFLNFQVAIANAARLNMIPIILGSI